MKSYYTSQRAISLQPSPRNAKLLWVFLWLTFIIHYSPFINSTYGQACTPNVSVMAQWSFSSQVGQCNGLTINFTDRYIPRLYKNRVFFCPDINSGCGQTLLGSIAHTNTTNFFGALCLESFYNPNATPGSTFNTESSVWDPKVNVNLYTSYKLPAGKQGCLTGFNVKILQNNKTTPNFEKQGVAVYRNDVLIYSQAQYIATSNINGIPMKFTFPSTDDFCSDGSKEVNFNIVFGLVHRFGTIREQIGYDDITIWGTCGSSPSTIATVTPATCGATGVNNNAKITLSNFGATDRYAYSTGSTYTGTATYASGSTIIPATGIIASTLANPATPQTYAVRVFTPTCYTDKTVTLNPVICPVICSSPTGKVTAVSATCTGTTANSDAKIAVTAVTYGDKVAISTGSTYTGTATYATATSLVSAAYTFTGLPNPATNQIYTVRIYNGSNTCFRDYQVTLTSTDCTPTSCTFPDANIKTNTATCTGSASNSDAQINISGVTNGDKAAYSLGSSYTGTTSYTTATALVGGTTNFTGLANPAVSQVYTVRIFNGKDNCYKDFPITINTTICVPTCITPTGTVTTTQATCTGSTANSDAKIAISAVSNGDKVAYSIGSVFSGNDYTTATLLVGSAYTFEALPNTAGGQIYTIRIYNGSNACYRDYSVTINEKICVPACTKPVGTITPTDATCTAGTANNDAKVAITAVTNGDKVGIVADDTYMGPAYSTATTLVSGASTFTALSNPTSVATYTIRVFNGSDVCYQDYNVNINSTICTIPIPPCIPPMGTVLTATQATCAVSGMTNMDAKVTVTSVTGGDKVGIWAGSSYTGVSYAKATALTSGAYTFTGLSNPDGSQVYTIRVFNGADDCFTDQTVTLIEKICGTCQTACGIISSALATDAVSSNNTACYTVCTGTQNIDLKLTAGVSPTSGSTCGTTGTDFVWTFTLQNTGTMAATDIQVADLMPTGLTFVSSIQSTGTYSSGAGWLVPSLAVGTSATLTVTTKALVAGAYKYTAEVQTALPLNDPNSTPGNGVTTEDDYSSATITVTGNSSPTISQEFSPMQTQANKPTRLTIKISNNESTAINLTQDFIANLPATPESGIAAAMVVAATPNLSSNLTSVIATAGSTSIKIPSGTVLLPGLNQISVDITVPSDGVYCNNITVGSLQTTKGINCLVASACIVANSTFQIPPSIKKTFSSSSINTNTNTTLTITIENRDTQNFTLNENFTDFLPAGLVLAGVTSGTCPNISTFGSSNQIGITAGAVIPSGSCTIVVPVKATTAGTYCNRIVKNQLLGTIGTNVNVGNQDIAEACLSVVSTPCTAINLTSITQSPAGKIAPNSIVTFTLVGTGIDPAKTALNWSSTSVGGSFNIQGNTATWRAPSIAGTYSIKVDADNQITGFGTCTTSILLTAAVQSPCGTTANCVTVTVTKNP